MPTIEELQERIIQLEEMLGLRDQPPPIGVPPTSAKLLGLLMRIRFVPCETAYSALYGDREGGASSESVRSHVKRLREILAPYGVEIKNLHGQGYLISQDDKQKLLALWPEMKRAA